MAEESRGSADYLICRSTEKDDYSIWRVDIDGKELLSRVTSGTFDHSHQLIPIGNYILEWGPITLEDYSPCFPYRLFKFNANLDNPLGLNVGSVKKGTWPKKKFWGTRPDFGNPDGPAKDYDKGKILMLVPLGTFILNVIPTTGRGTFKLFYFDPGSIDPLYFFPTWIAGAFETIQFGHELIPLGNYVLDRLVDPKLPVDEKGKYWLWSFDPMEETPLARPAIQTGRWDDIDDNHQLIPIGEYVLDWDTMRGRYRLWNFDPRSRNPNSSNPLAGPIKEGLMPEGFGANMTLIGVQGLRPVDAAHLSVPGTIDFMRSKIKHVVYYMIENRSFDHICGWLYEHGEEGINFVPPYRNGPFEGAKPEMFNLDPDVLPPNPPKKVPLEKLQEGESILKSDPYHDMTDTMRHCFFENRNGYANRTKGDMGGFVWNQGNHNVMKTFTPEQLPVLNGLAKAFAVSDEWFSSMPGATDSERAFALTGSALGELNNFMNGPQYINWPDLARRASIWKVLWANGFTDWKIYNSVDWFNFILTYQLFLKGQIPTVDADVAAYLAGSAERSKYLGTIDQFMKDAQSGKLPAFSFLEPVWIEGGGSNKAATSYHPYGGGGTRPGEAALKEIYEVLKASTKWDKTLLIITFDEHGGFFDHVPPPYAANPWPNDENDGFRYDLMGVRVPTILVSPWIKERTVFRSSTPVAYDSTSILATLLHWYGIPKARWGLGERTHHAPTFEGVFQSQSARTDSPPIELPPEKLFAPVESQGLSDLDQLMAWRVAASLVGDKRSAREVIEIANDVIERAQDVESLNTMISDLAKRMR